MLKRKATDYIKNWLNTKDRKCLVVQGARQTGKTYIIERFAEENFEELVEINFKQMQISEIKDFLVHLEEYQKTADETWLDIDPDTGIKACDDTSDGEHYSHFDRIYTCLEDYMKILDEEIGRLEQRSRSWWKRLMDKAGCL